jgi:hypothetical protein
VYRVTLRQGFLRPFVLSYSCGLACTVDTATRYEFDGPKFKTRSAYEILFTTFQTGPKAHPTSCINGTGALSRRLSGWTCWPITSSSAKIINTVNCSCNAAPFLCPPGMLMGDLCFCSGIPDTLSWHQCFTLTQSSRSSWWLPQTTHLKHSPSIKFSPSDYKLEMASCDSPRGARYDRFPAIKARPLSKTVIMLDKNLRIMPTFSKRSEFNTCPLTFYLPLFNHTLYFSLSLPSGRSPQTQTERRNCNTD